MAEVHVMLEPMDESHTSLVLRWRSDPAVGRELFSARPPTCDEHIAWLRTLGEKRREFVILALPERVPVGTVGLSGIDPYHGTAEVGVLIGEAEYRGRGYARAACAMLLRYAFDTLHLHRVYLRAFASNAAGLALYKRLGFMPEGVLRKHARRVDRFEDVVLMGMLESEWRSHESAS